MAIRPGVIRWSDATSLGSAAAEAIAAAPVLDAGLQVWLHRAGRFISESMVLRTMLAARLGRKLDEVELMREPCRSCGGPHGKPVVVGEAIGFSLSHSGPWTLIAFAMTDIGIDIESEVDHARAATLAAQLHPREAARLAEFDRSRLRSELTRTWVRKEAYLKALGTGLTRPIRLDYVGVGPEPVSPPGWTVTDVIVPDARHAALVVRSKIGHLGSFGER
jgi:4'-phosphopantetheinyl transferase